MKTFYCAEDVERLAAQGTTELVVDEETVLTDLARDVARQWGVALVRRSSGRPAAVVPAAPAVALGTTVQLGARPKGCQHGPLDGGEPGPATASRSGSGVVDQLVDLVKHLGAEGPAG